MPFQDLLQFGDPVTEPRLASPRAPKKTRAAAVRKPSKQDKPCGCDVCPLNKVPGVKKIFGDVRGMPIAIFAQSPGPRENEEGIALTGPAGQWWWDELSRVGLTRLDFDIQNTVRCFPCTPTEGSYDTYLKMRDPSAEEIRCCSVHNDAAVAKLKAKQILVLGKIAAKALLKTRSLPTQKIFWSDALNARIYLLDHPSYFVRGYAPAERLKAFRDTLDMVVRERNATPSEATDLSDPFAFIKKQDYRLVTNWAAAVRASKIIRKYVAKGRHIAIDIEGVPGKKVICCGFSPRRGLSFVFVFHHDKQDPASGQCVQKMAKKLLEDVSAPYSLQYGCTDVTELAKCCDINVANFAHDTNLSEYLRFSDRKAYGLEATAEARFPEFSGYALVIAKDLVKHTPEIPDNIRTSTADAQIKYIYKHKLLDMSKLSLNTLRLYNGADCDLTGRITSSNVKHVNPALMKVYIDLSFVLREMEPNGPYFDAQHNDILGQLYPQWEAELLAELREMVGNPDFNPASHDQVYDAVYNKLGLEYPFDGKPNTQKKTMLMLGREHPFPLKVVKIRSVSKAKGTYVEGYKKCSELNSGRLRTKWWSTGTRTGRLSSGGKKDDPGVINLQNIHGDPQLQNMCVADIRWRKVYKRIARLTEKYPDLVAFQKALDVWAKKKAKLRDKFKEPKPVATSELKVQLTALYRKIENWIKKNCPDLRTFLILDYGQVEVRVAALLANDENLKADCEKSDIHTAVGVTMTGWDPDMIANDKKTRTLTKNVHFGILFGIGKKNLYSFVVAMTDPNEQDTISQEVIEDAYDRYFERYPGIRRFIDAQREFARENGYVETLFGMRQNLVIREGDEEDDSEFYSDEGARSSYWGNQAVNGVVQGTAHQVLECALINLKRQRKKYEVLGWPTMDVHDALYTMVEVLRLPLAYKKLRCLMEKESLKTVASDFPDIKWDVPIVTEAEAGLRLGCKVELEEGFTPGEFLYKWYWKCRAQVISLNKELAKLPKVA